jgi:serine/threonine-protein kinase
MNREPDALLRQVVGGRWRLLEVLGATEHGTAFRGETVEGAGLVRVELWDARHVQERGELARFERQARTLSRLRHERCVSLVGFGVHEGRPYFVSELPAGRSLRDELGKPELTLRRALSLGLQLCEGLRHLHGHGVVHRLLLPENVWVSGDALKIGVPRIGSSSAGADQRADIHAASRLLYAMCTGQEPPAEAGAPVPRPRAISPDRGISEGLERLLLRALSPSAQLRFGAADELLAALESVGALPPTPARPAPRSGKRTALVAGGLAVVATVLVVAALRGGESSEPSAPPAAPIAQAPRPPVQPVVEPPPPPKVVVAPPPVEPKPAPPPAPIPPPVPAAPPAKAKPREPSPDEREIWSLLDKGRTDEAGARIKSLVFRDPEAAWPRLAFGAFYYRKLWRGDAVKQWRLALERDPEIHRNPELGAYLCFMLDDSWKAAGMTELLAQLGPKAVPLLERCVESAKTPRLRAHASRALDALRRPGITPERP